MLILSHNGVEWHGTFGVVLRALVVDLLSDEEPFDARVQFDLPGGDQATWDVTVVDIGDHFMFCRQGNADVEIPLEQVLSVEVA
jgi:hypothetical protein